MNVRVSRVQWATRAHGESWDGGTGRWASDRIEVEQIPSTRPLSLALTGDHMQLPSALCLGAIEDDPENLCRVDEPFAALD